MWETHLIACQSISERSFSVCAVSPSPLLFVSEGSVCTSFLLSFASVKCFLIFEGHFSSMKLAAVLTELRV